MTPQITLTATAENIAGATSAGQAQLQIYLCGYGSTPPRVIGSAIIAEMSKAAVATAGSISTTLWGNDVITPAGTFYCIVTYDSNGNVIGAANYKVTGGGTKDLSMLTPYIPTTTATPVFLVFTDTVTGLNVALIPANGGLELFPVFIDSSSGNNYALVSLQGLAKLYPVSPVGMSKITLFDINGSELAYALSTANGALTSTQTATTAGAVTEWILQDITLIPLPLADIQRGVATQSDSLGF